ncbi:MAG: hypothetical protein FWF92_06425 [Oscillospiraceae bacterium]|nr:hypothetical protein [Oscillospiraceae bacterium]
MQHLNLENLYWIGGCPSGGKTTLAGEISRISNIPIYHTDEHSLDYGLRINAKVPDFHREINMNFVESTVAIPDEPWFNIFITGLRELCSIALDDITKLFVGSNAIIEGGILLPEFISKMGIENQAIFINPTYEYLHECLPKQKWVINILSGISDAEYKSLFIKRLLFKYNLFREYVIESAEKFNIKTIFTATPNSLDNNVKIALQHLSLYT